MFSPGRYKCTLGRCTADFDDESQRDLHEALETHCDGCGILGVSLCQFCRFDESDFAESLLTVVIFLTLLFTSPKALSQDENTFQHVAVSAVAATSTCLLFRLAGAPRDFSGLSAFGVTIAWGGMKEVFADPHASGADMGANTIGAATGVGSCMVFDRVVGGLAPEAPWEDWKRRGVEIED